MADRSRYWRNLTAKSIVIFLVKGEEHMGGINILGGGRISRNFLSGSEIQLLDKKETCIVLYVFSCLLVCSLYLALPIASYLFHVSVYKTSFNEIKL